jgi:hypothetical protein
LRATRSRDIVVYGGTAVTVHIDHHNFRSFVLGPVLSTEGADFEAPAASS